MTDKNSSGWDDNPAAPLPKLKSNTLAMRDSLSNAQAVEDLVERCIDASIAAHEGKFEAERAQNTAAMFLTAELKLTLFIGDIELRAKDAKNEIERVEAEKYFELKTNSVGKITEGALAQSVAREKDVIVSKKACAAAEAEAKKWNNLLGVLKDGHIFFRNIGKANNI